MDSTLALLHADRLAILRAQATVRNSLEWTADVIGVHKSLLALEAKEAKYTAAIAALEGK